MTRNGWRARLSGPGTLTLAIVASVSLRAQTPQATVPVVATPQASAQSAGPNPAPLATPQGASPGSRLPSPQYLSPACEQALAGLPYTTGGAGVTLKQLIRMSPAELEELYAQGCLAPIPPGKIKGQALLNPGTRMAVPTSRGSRLVWQGKVIRPDGQSAINLFFGLQVIKANVYSAESWRDGRPALILDYSETSVLYAPYRDEIRQIGPGLYLGLMFDRKTAPPKLKMYFALECQPGD